MDISPAFITDEQTPVSMEPGKSPLDNPTVFSKMSRAVNPSSGNSVFYVPYYARLPAKWKIISFISAKFLRTANKSPTQISQGWHGEGFPKHQLPANPKGCTSRSSHCCSPSPAAGFPITYRAKLVLVERNTRGTPLHACKGDKGRGGLPSCPHEALEQGRER